MKVPARLHACLLLKQRVQDTLQTRNGVRVHVSRKEARLLVLKALLQCSEVTRGPVCLQKRIGIVPATNPTIADMQRHVHPTTFRRPSLSFVECVNRL